MPIEWPEQIDKHRAYSDWHNMPYEQRMRRIAWFTRVWFNIL